MNYFLQFRPDKSDTWRMYTEQQIAAGDLPSPPTFQTVLMVSHNPDEVMEQELDLIDTLKYVGPMYFDFDDKHDLDRVIGEANAVIDYLMNKLDIPEQYIHCYLSGGKGVHITVPYQVFGVKGPTKALPMIYKEIMMTAEAAAGLITPSTLDYNVYSCGKGRMWRCEGMPRPGSGTFKVATTPNELAHMDADEYLAIVAAARPTAATPYPPKELTFLKCEALYKAARTAANKKIRAMKEACTVPAEVFREWEGIPGCVERLITDGDCGESNWNQAAMQLASYIAAAYTKEDEKFYLEHLVRPFTKNVQSSSRANENERYKHVKDQLNRTFRGSFKFAPGAFIAAIGTPCRQCPICRPDIAKGESSQSEAGTNYHHDSKIRFDERGYWLVGENSSRQLTNFVFFPNTEVFELMPSIALDGSPAWKESPRRELRGTLLDENGTRIEDMQMPERTWGSRRDLINTVKGHAACAVFASDAEIQKMLQAIVFFAKERAESKELDKMIRADVCGLILDRSGKHPVPHYVESDASINSMGGRSAYRFNGNPRQSPALLSQSNPFVDDVELETAIRALCHCNEPVQMAMLIGWFAACHYRQHIQFEEPQFPVCNISGNAGSGKTSLAMLIAMINGIDYTRAEFQNVEVGTFYPLVKFVSSSTTVPRLVEEVNPVMLGAQMYAKIAGVLKASWNSAPIQRGRLTDRDVGVTEDRVSAPLVYTSEQLAAMPSLRSRSVEVRLQARTLTNDSYKTNFKIASSKRQSLLRLAKAMVTVAMGTSPKALLEIFDSKADLVHKALAERPKWGMQTCLTGLHMLMHTMKEFKVGGVEEVQRLNDALVEYLGGQVMISERGKSASEVDKVLTTLNTMADPTFEERYRLEPGLHYWRQGDQLYLVLQSCMPRYLGYTKSVGEIAPIRNYDQLATLLEGEVYFERMEPHPHREVDVFVVNQGKLTDKGTLMNNFNDSTEALEA
jgi:hypothetical protein